MNDAKATSWICPQCHCLLHHQHVEKCLKCGEPLGWVDAATCPRFFEALQTSGHPARQIAARTVRLVVELRFGKEHSRVVGFLDQEISATILGKTLVVRPILGKNGISSVEIVLGTKRSTLDLPCRRTLQENLELKIWQHVSAAGDGQQRNEIELPRCGVAYLRNRPETIVGRVDWSDVQVRHPSIDENHFVIAYNVKRDASPPEYWIVDWQSSGLTFVDGKSILARKLTGGELIQAGQFAFLFTRDGRLLPETGIAGCAVNVPVGYRVGERLALAHGVSIPSGECVGIVGPSGAGKSTLLKAIAHLSENRGSGGIRVDGAEVGHAAANSIRSWWRFGHQADTPSITTRNFRDLLGYLSQEPFVHEALTALQVMTFIAALRCPAKGLGEADFENILRELEIPDENWNRPIGLLSGGEQKRVRIAAEMISTPRLFLLDEPGSGLDAKREQTVMKMLRNLSHRGCTVVVVTHGRDLAPFFDLVIRVTKRDGKSLVETFRGDTIPVAFSEDAAPDIAAVDPPMSRVPQPAKRPIGSGRGRVISQLATLLLRERALMSNEVISRVVIPLAIPCLFA
ncbi:MAG: ATP-binding cassette domain-containing protein, partial [Planctomycetota bacterium]